MQKFIKSDVNKKEELTMWHLILSSDRRTSHVKSKTQALSTVTSRPTAVILAAFTAQCRC